MLPMRNVAFLLALAWVSSADAAPPDYSALARQRRTWRTLRDESLNATFEVRRSALTKLLDEATRQTSSLEGFDPGRAHSGERIVAPFSLLPVLLDFAEQIAATDPRLMSVGYRIVRADRARLVGWTRRVPKKGTLSEYRAWAKEALTALPSVATELSAARKALSRMEAPSTSSAKEGNS